MPDPRLATVEAAERLVRAWEWAEEHPEDAHSADEIDYAEDLLKAAVKGRDRA
jgi:hypothetical protein